MTIEEIKEQIVPKWVRVIGNTFNVNDTTESMVGGVFEVFGWPRKDTVCVINEEKSTLKFFNRSDVQILTPVVHKGYRIGIGDMVDDKEVVGWNWSDGSWSLTTIADGDLEDGTYALGEHDFESVTPLYPSKDAEVEKAIKLLESKGVIKDGKVIVR